MANPAVDLMVAANEARAALEALSSVLQRLIPVAAYGLRMVPEIDQANHKDFTRKLEVAKEALSRYGGEAWERYQEAQGDEESPIQVRNLAGKKENVRKVYLTEKELGAILGALNQVDSMHYHERALVYQVSPNAVREIKGKLEDALYPEEKNST